jgi:hypothetical protein
MQTSPHTAERLQCIKAFVSELTPKEINSDDLNQFFDFASGIFGTTWMPNKEIAKRLRGNVIISTKDQEMAVLQAHLAILAHKYFEICKP